MTARRRAVLVASGRFPDESRLEELRGPENDVEVLSRLLSDEKRGGFDDCVVLKNRPHHEVLLKINQTVKSAGKDDLVLLYYSGHGKLDAAGRLHLATCDTTVDNLEATSIPVQSIRNYLDLTRSTRTLLILDCCFSGAVGDAFLRSGVDDQLQLFSRGRGTYLMSASTGLQVAREDLDAAHGAFSRHLLLGLETGAADLDGDGLISVDELYAYVHERMRGEGFQEPMKWDLNVKGELIVARSPAPAGARTAEERLAGIAASEVLPESVLSAARELLGSPPPDGETGDPRGARRALLEELLQGRMKVNEFIESWYRLEEPEPMHAQAASEPTTPAQQSGLRPPPSRPSRVVSEPDEVPRRRFGFLRWVRPVRPRARRSRMALAAMGLAGVFACTGFVFGGIDAVDRLVESAYTDSANWKAPSSSVKTARRPSSDTVSFSSWERTETRTGPDGKLITHVTRSPENTSLSEFLARDARRRARYSGTVTRYDRTAKEIIDSIGR